MITVYSFDVFDTCLTRRTAVATDVFYEAARKVFVKLGIPLRFPLIEDFVVARVNAERIARQHSNSEDISLYEIWKNLTQAMAWEFDDTLPICELEAEADSLVPVLPIREQVQAVRQQGHRIIFVSDMYLPKEFIELQLIKHKFAQKGDGFYVSNDVGKTKISGNLFKHLLAHEKVPASNVWHTGDNQQSDCDVPRKLGIRVQLFSNANLSRTEFSLMQTSQHFRGATRIAGAMRMFRLGDESKAKRGINELASQFVAPLVMGFATWVLRQAQENGVKRLYFMSRDCQLVWKVARELSSQFGGIDCRYLYVSRQALFFPSSAAISPGEMPWMERFFEEPTLDRLLAKLELKYQDVEANFNDLAGSAQGKYRLKSSNDWELFWKLLNEKTTKSRILNLITKRRDAARRYFESVGLFEPAPWALVDLGWHLTCQSSLWKLLKSWKRDQQIQGYYLGLSNRRIGWAEAGAADALFYQHPPDCHTQLSSPTIFSFASLLEHIVGSADHPTVHHYEVDKSDNGKPFFLRTTDDKTLQLCRNLHDGVLEFVINNQALVRDFSNTTNCRIALETIIASFAKSPTKGMAIPLVGISAASDQNNLDSLPIIKPLNWKTVLLPLLPKCKPFADFFKNKDCIWMEGSMAITPIGLKRLSKIVQKVINFRTRIYHSVANRLSNTSLDSNWHP